MNTTISYTIQSTVPPASMNSQGGYQLDISVVATNQIDPNVFIYQRSPESDGSQVYQDFFYTVASVADLYSVPVGNPAQDDGFYRTDSISLVFSSMQDLESSLGSIRGAVSDLCLANDAFMNLSSVRLVAFPPTASNTYFGTVSDPSVFPTDSQIRSMTSIQGLALPTQKTLQEVGSGEYVCVALPELLGPVDIKLNGTPCDSNVLVRNFVGPTGLNQSYSILVAQTSIPGNISIEVSQSFPAQG